MAHIYPDKYRVLGGQPMNKIVMGKHILDGIVTRQIDTGDLDLFPQLFIYGFEARIEPQTPFKIKIALTDYYDSVYLFDNEIYFDLFVEIDRNVTRYNHIRGGDHTVNFGILPEGEHSISLQIIDSLGRKSQRIFYDILVSPYEIRESETFRATLSDIATYGITLNLTETSDIRLMKNNKIGINNLMNDKKTEGFKKLVLPANGIYRVFHSKRDSFDPTNPYIRPISNFTLDLNGSTLKLHSYLDKDGLGANLVVRFDHCYDSHIINGTFDGDWVERQLRKSEFSSFEGEGAGNISFYGNSKFCTLRNVTTKNVTGYNIGSSFGNPTLTAMTGGWTGNTVIDELNGGLISRVEYATSKMEDITKFLTFGQIACNKWLGYGGLAGSQFEILLSFYDENQLFIEQIQVFQHRMCKIPLQSKFMRTTVKAPASDCTSLYLHSHSTPKATALLNCHWEKNRTCVAPAQFQHWLMKNCTFFESGESITPCAIDLEDGWEQMQDFFLIDSDIQEQAGTTDLIVNSGLNIHVEGGDNWRMILRRGLSTRVINNNTRTSLGSEVGPKSSLSRYYDNELTGMTFTNSNNVAPTQVVKNKNTISNKNVNAPPGVLYGGSYQIGWHRLHTSVGVTISKCETTSDHYSDGENLFYCCKFVGNTTYPIYTIHFNSSSVIKKNQWLECIFEVPTVMRSHNNFVAGYWSECLFLNTVEINPHTTTPIGMGDIQFNNCVFEKLVKYNNRPIQFNNCTFKQGATCTGVSTAQFNNCIGN